MLLHRRSRCLHAVTMQLCNRHAPLRVGVGGFKHSKLPANQPCLLGCQMFAPAWLNGMPYRWSLYTHRHLLAHFLIHCNRTLKGGIIHPDTAVCVCVFPAWDSFLGSVSRRRRSARNLYSGLCGDLAFTLSHVCDVSKGLALALVSCARSSECLELCGADG